MLIEEFGVFTNLYNNLLNFEAWHQKNIQRQAESKSQIQRVMESTSQSFGFFKKISKEEKLDELRKADESIQLEVEVGNELLSLVYKLVEGNEIPMLKKYKKMRFDRMIYEFSQSRIQELEKELLLWQTVGIMDEPNEEEIPENKKIDGQDFRFTELPRLREPN